MSIQTVQKRYENAGLLTELITDEYPSRDKHGIPTIVKNKYLKVLDRECSSFFYVNNRGSICPLLPSQRNRQLFKVES
jgi:hypothetical protein